MPRRLRFASGGYVYHVLNRAVARQQIFDNAGDYAAFERVLKEAKRHVPMRLLAYAILPNHWHLLVWPFHDGDLSEHLHWLTMTHTQRWHAHHHTVGTGPLYQGRYKSFPVEADAHLLVVCRYVERNPLRANLVPKAETWRWGSLWHRLHDTAELFLDPWPMDIPSGWVAHVNAPESELELAALRRSVVRGSPFGAESWRTTTAKKLGLLSTLRPRGRPRLIEPAPEQ
jgi:putative transposase